MHDQSDAQLLRAYAEHGTEAAFAEIVVRHTDLVYSAALRQVYSPDLARDVTQSVFTDLARKAREVSFKLNPEASLVGWLYRSTRFAARDLNRTEIRRTQRERLAMEQVHSAPESTPDWEQLRPALDDAMAELDDSDRDALLLRYFKNHDLRVVGATLGISDDAAQKRVSRAVERLRELFAKRGVTVGASGLAVVISANAVQAAPVGLALTISAAAALTGTTLATTATVTASTAIAMTTLQKTIVAAIITVLAGAGLYEARHASQLREQVQVLQQQQAPLVDQNHQLNLALTDATNQLAAFRDDNKRLSRNTGELLKLRQEANRLRNDAQELAQLKATEEKDPTVAEAVQWKARVTALKQHLEQNPRLGIPELQFATGQDWLNAARKELKTEEDYRRAMSDLRSAVVSRFANDMQSALRKYMDANHKQFPADLSQLQPYFQAPVDVAILQQYAILPKNQLPNLGMGGDWIISQKAPVDADFDGRVGIGPNGWGTAGPQSWNDPLDSTLKKLDPVMKAYAAANSGQEPGKPSDLLPFINTPEQKAAYEQALKFLEANKRDE